MKKIAAIALTLSVIGSSAFAQSVPPVDPTAGAEVAPTNAPTVVVGNGLTGGAGIALALVPLLLLAVLSGGSSNSSSHGTSN